MSKSIRALVVALLLAFCAPAAAFAESHLSSDPAVTSARALVNANEFDHALAILRSLDPDHPDRVDVLFLTGMAAIGASHGWEEDSDERDDLLDEAIAALRTVLIDRPELVRVRLELARAFFLKEEDDLARGHFERVLAGRPIAPVAANIQRFLAAIRARKRWSYRASVALAPDSNLGAASEEQTIYILGLPFQRDADAGARSGIGAIVSGGAEYQHPLSERVRLRAGGDVAQREYEGSDFDRTSASAHLGPRWLVDPATEASLLASASRQWTAGTPENHTLGGRLEVRRRLSQRATAQVHGSWQERTYKTSTHLDGPLSAFSVGGSWIVSPTVQIDGALGYSRERPQDERWRNTTRWARVGVSVALPYGFTVGGGGEYRRTDYEGRWSPFVLDGSAREDETRILRVTVFNRLVTVFGFSPQLVLVNEDRTSNAQLYDYQRNRAELRLQRLF